MNSLFERPFTFDRVTRIVFSIVIIGVLLYLITVLRNALLPFLIAWLLAYMMQPFVKFFQYKLKYPGHRRSHHLRIADYRDCRRTGRSVCRPGSRADPEPDAHA